MRKRLSIFPLVCTVLVWGLLGVSAVYWTFALTEPPPRDRLPDAPVVPQIKPSAISAWLGAGGVTEDHSPASGPRRYELLGIIAQGRSGVALLAVDGQAPRPYLVGTVVEDGVMLRAVGPRHAELAADRKGPVLQRLELPVPPELPPPEGLTLSARTPR